MTPTTPPLDWELMERYLLEEVTPQERAQAQQVLRERSDVATALEVVERRLDPSDGESARRSAEMSYAAFERRIHRDAIRSAPSIALVHAHRTSGTESVPRHLTEHTSAKSSHVPRPWSRMVGYSVAAMALVVVAVFGWSDIARVVRPAAQQVAVKEYRTAVGQRAKITLPDSSTIILAPMSSVRYATNFGSSSDRTVTLEGQALFTVTHSTGVPFIVQTGQIHTRVLGTSFAVRRYGTEPNVKVVVAQGRVAVGQSVLSTGDIAIATAPEKVSISRGNAVVEQLAWTEGRLVFSRVPLREVIPELERWYGITIEVPNKALLDRPVVTALGPENAAEAVDLVAFAIEGRVEFNGRHAVIHSR